MFGFDSASLNIPEDTGVMTDDYIFADPVLYLCGSTACD